MCILPAVPLPQEGRFAVVTDVGSGMRWTRQCRKTSDTGADGEGVWSWRPDAGAKSAMMLRIAPMTGAKEPGPRGEHDISRKTIAQGMPAVAAYLWLLTGVLFVAHAAAGALRSRHSLRPLAYRGTPTSHQLGARTSPAGVKLCLDLVLAV
jgi:hypothetical protein